MPESQPDGDASQNSFAALFSELRRRRVVQVAGIYLLSGSGLIQAADVVLENLGAPAAIARWLTLLVIAGFPVAVTISWAYDVRVQRERLSQSGDVLGRVGVRGRLAFGAGILLGMVLLGAVALRVAWGSAGQEATAESSGLSKKPVLAVYTVELLGGEHVRSFAAVLQTGLDEALGQTTGVTTRSQDVLDSYRSLSIPLDSLAARLDIDYLVGARVTATPAATRLTVQVLDARGTVVATSDPFAAGAPSLESAQELTRKAADFVLRQVGAELQANRWRYGTRSQDALYALIDAEELIGRAARQPERSQAARDLLAEADELLSHSMVADPRWSEPALRRAELAVKRAVATRDDGTGAVAAMLDEGLAIVDDVLRREPRNADAHAARGMLAYNRALQLPLDSVAHARALAGAERSLQRALDLDRTLAGAAAQLSDLLYWRADFANARVWAERALARDSYQERAEPLWYQLAMATFEVGDDSTALQLCRGALQRFGESPMHQGCVLEVLAFGDGMADVADAWHRLGRIEEVTHGDPRTAAFYQVEVAAVLARAGLRDSAEHVLAAARTRYAQQFRENENMLWLEAAARFRLEQHDSASALLRSYIARQPPTLKFNLARRALRAYLRLPDAAHS